MAPTGKLLAAEEFEQLPDDGKLYELTDGQLREITPRTPQSRSRVRRRYRLHPPGTCVAPEGAAAHHGEEAHALAERALILTGER